MTFVLLFLSFLTTQSPTAANQLLIRADDTDCSDRSVWDLVWSCAGTMFTCLWVAIHPNIPGVDESGWASFKKRLLTMIYGFLAPEVVVMWAMRQSVNARKIAMQFNAARGHPEPPPLTVWSVLRDVFTQPMEGIKVWFHGPLKTHSPLPKWTMTHGFFIQMGGFMLYKDGKPWYTLTYQELERLIDIGAIDIPTIEEPEIQDKSKGDFLQKAFVTLQTMWFVVQCLARWKTSLPLSELEVVTLAFAALNWFTNAVWWFKPQNVQTPVAVHLKASFTEKDIALSADKTPSLPPAQGEVQATPPVETPAPEETSQPELNQVTTERRAWIIRYLSKDIKRFSKYGFFGVFWLIFYRIPYRLLESVLRPIDKMAGADKVPLHANRIPMYYADGLTDNEENIITMIMLFSSTVFGALHCVAWSYPFPSQSQLWLWRTSTLIMIGMPAMCLVISFISDGFNKYTGPEIPEGCFYQTRRALMNTVGIILVMAFAPVIPGYLAARVAVLVQAILSLWNLPSGTLQDVEWTKFIPHIR